MKPILLAILVALGITCSAHARTLYNGKGGAIPNFNPAGAGTPGVFTSTITVPDNFVIGDVDVTLTGLTHTWSGDLIIQVEKIGGPTALLVSRVGSIGGTFGASADYGGNYTFDSQSANNIWLAASGSPTAATIAAGTYTTSDPGVNPPYGAANNSLGAFNGLNAAGQWRLTITDTASVDAGSITGWSLNIIPGPGAFALLALAGCRRRRTR